MGNNDVMLTLVLVGICIAAKTVEKKPHPWNPWDLELDDARRPPAPPPWSWTTPVPKPPPKPG